MGVSVRVFFSQISIWIGKLSEANALPSMGDIIQSVEGLNRTKRAEKGQNCSVWANTSILPCPQTWVLRVLKLSDSEQDIHHSPHNAQTFRPELNYTMGLHGSPLAVSRSWHFSACITTWANSYNIYPLMYLSLSLSLYEREREREFVLFLWRILTSTWQCIWVFFLRLLLIIIPMLFLNFNRPLICAE